ncbi:MAG TPA: 30S ribosomal protein S20 [Candidatus Paceibacterota bacterium]
MPITRGAKKAQRQSLRRREFNIARKDNVAKAVKSLKKLIAAGSNLTGSDLRKAAQVEMRKVQQALDKAVKGKTLKKGTASRKKSRLSKLIKKL